MSFDGSVHCWIPDPGLARSDEWRLKVAQFGDGYSQRALDGINALQQSWQVAFETREAEIINDMVAYLVAQKAKSFDFLEPQTGILYSVFCDAWTVTWLFKRPGALCYGTLEAEFKRAFGVTA